MDIRDIKFRGKRVDNRRMGRRVLLQRIINIYSYKGIYWSFPEMELEVIGNIHENKELLEV